MGSYGGGQLKNREKKIRVKSRGKWFSWFTGFADFGGGFPLGEYRKTRNLQRVHVVLFEEHGWLFFGIYDGFSGPEAPVSFFMSHLYKVINKELERLLWDYEAKSVNDLLNLEFPMNRDAAAYSEYTKENPLISQLNKVTCGTL